MVWYSFLKRSLEYPNYCIWINEKITNPNPTYLHSICQFGKTNFKFAKRDLINNYSHKVLKYHSIYFHLLVSGLAVLAEHERPETAKGNESRRAVDREMLVFSLQILPSGDVVSEEWFIYSIMQWSLCHSLHVAVTIVLWNDYIECQNTYEVVY